MRQACSMVMSSFWDHCNNPLIYNVRRLQVLLFINGCQYVRFLTDKLEMAENLIVFIYCSFCSQKLDLYLFFATLLLL